MNALWSGSPTSSGIGGRSVAKYAGFSALLAVPSTDCGRPKGQLLMSAVDARLNLSNMQGAEFPSRGVSNAGGAGGEAVAETAALFAIGTVADAKAALFITGRGLRRPRTDRESPPRCAVRRNSCRSLLDISNFSSPAPFFEGVAGGGAGVASVFTAVGGVVFVAAFASVVPG